MDIKIKKYHKKSGNNVHFSPSKSDIDTTKRRIFRINYLGIRQNTWSLFQRQEKKTNSFFSTAQRMK